MLSTYIESQKSDSITEVYEKEDWENYRILVHALKSTSLSIGAVRLSEQAKALEEAAKEKNIEYIRDCHESMMISYRDLLDGLERVMQENASKLLLGANQT